MTGADHYWAGVRAVAEDPTLRQVLILVKNGVPWDVSICLPDDEREGMLIACGLNDGARYDWTNRRWLERE